MKNTIRIGFVPLCMASFDAVLDVDDVKAGQIPDISAPAYLQQMVQLLKTYGEVIETPVTGNEAQAEETNAMLRAAGIDVLVVHEFAFTLATTFMRLIDQLEVPIVFWNAQMIAGIDESAADFGTFMANNSVSSIPHSTNVLFQYGKDFKVITGNADDAAAQAEFARYFQVVRTKKALQQAKIGSIGYVYPGMSTIMVNDTTFTKQFGVSIDHINPVEVRNYYRKVSDETAASFYDDHPYPTEGLNRQELLRSSKYYYALKEMVADKNLDALAMLCGLLILDDEMGVAPCLALSQLTADGIYSTCECDIPTATAMLIADQLAGNAHFTEFYMMDMHKGNVLMAHCGYGSMELANPKYGVRLVKQPCFPGPGGCGAAFEYVAKPGDMTLLCITSAPTGYKLVAANVEAQDVPVCKGGCPQIVIKFKGMTMAEGVEKYCKAGGSHHMVACYGDITQSLEALCRMLNVGYERVC